MEKQENGKWEINPHYSQIADTGGYNGYWELTNGTISIVTKDEVDNEDPDYSSINTVVNVLNTLDHKWENWDLDNAKYELHLEKENCKKWKEIATALYTQIVEADNCINYDQLGKHRATLSKDISKAIRGYEQTKANTL